MIYLYFDGACKPNPGKMGIGYVLMDEGGNVLEKGKKRLGLGTNNVAEYLALLEGLKSAMKYGDRVTIRGDSKLVIEQLRGNYKVKTPHLRELFEQVLELLRNFQEVRVEWVDEGENEMAHDLANSCLSEV